MLYKPSYTNLINNKLMFSGNGRMIWQVINNLKTGITVILTKAKAKPYFSR